MSTKHVYDIPPGHLEEKLVGSMSPHRQKRSLPTVNRLVSVIVRTKNRPALLREALQSVATQTYPHIEAVVVNDGGQDVEQLVRTFNNQPIQSVQYINLQPGRGRSAAANMGLQRATGDYLVFLDDDDWFLPEHITTLVEALENHIHVGLAYSAVKCVQKNDSGEWEQVYVFNQPFDATRLLVENYIPMHAALFRRDLVESGCRLDESLDIYEDWDFWVQLSQKTDFVFVDQLSAVYRIDVAGGFGISGDDRRVREALEIFFEKWRHRWSLTQVVDIASYAKHKSMYQELRKILDYEGNRLNEKHREKQNLMAELAVCHSDLAALNTQLQELHQSRQELASQRESLALQTERQIFRLQQAHSEIQRLAERITELENSHSWKITRPLRATTTALRRIYHTSRVSLNMARRYLILSYQILRVEGPRRLAERVYHKLSGQRRFQVEDVPIYHLEKAWQPLSFNEYPEPLISIVIPVHNQHLHTFTCLKSIADDDLAIPHEIIVVDDRSEDQTAEMLAAMKGLRVIPNQGERGFVHACNLGARHARGDYLLFLNNDTIVPQGWLKTLVDTFVRRPDAGLIGVRLIYPDGRLQEAGGIIWRDGSGWNYGRNDHPDKPEYNYLREVDYCSGACLAIPRQLFQKVGAFSEEFAPAYFEDADLAFKVKATDKKVLYQPAVTVVHFEGASSGRHTLSGLKSFQVINQHKFFQKWEHYLKAHQINGVLPELEKDRGVDKRVLVIDMIMLMPDQDSGSLRMARLLNIFQDLGYKVTFVASNLEYHEPYGPQLQQQGIEVLYAPFIYSIEKYLLENGKYFDVILVSRADAAERFLEMARTHAPSALLIFDTVDLHFLREERMAALNNSASLARAAAVRKKQELALMEKADITLVVSPLEKEVIGQNRPDLPVEVLSNIHEVYGSAANYDQREDIIFIGSFNHPPNTDAVLYYLKEILPLVQRELRDVKTYIVGSRPPPQITALASDRIIVTGHVPDISGYFTHCRLSIAPLRYGAGVKGKINMSMAYGVPVVATPIAVEGMYLTEGQDVIIGHDAQSFAQGIVNVYRDRVLWGRLSQNGLLNVEKYFSADAAKRVLRRLLSTEEVLA